MPLVSVLMPSYNHGNYIKEAINSVLNQSITALELIIIDDASSDNSLQIIKEFQEKDERIQVYFHQKNQGIATTLNQLLNLAQGEFISFIASDDVWYASKLKKQLKILKDNNNKIVWSEGEIINAQSQITGKRFTELYNLPQKYGNIFENLIRGNFIFGSSLIMRKDVLNGMKFDDDLKFLNDHKFWLDLAFKYDYYFISECLAQYRIHGKNTGFTNLSDWYNDSMKLSNYICRIYGPQKDSLSKKNLFYMSCANPLHHGLKIDPWNKINIYYLIVLPLWYIFIISRY